MENINKSITKNIVYLATNITNLSEVLAHLVEKEIISPTEKEIIKGKPTTFDQGEELFTILTKKDLKLRWNSTVAKILRKTANAHLADKIMESFPKDVKEQQSQNPTTAAGKKKSNLEFKDSDIALDPFGELNSICTKLKYGLPVYTEKMEGPSNDPTFECSCTINNGIESEKASKKAQAKRRVAHKWILILKAKNPELAK